MPTPTRGRAIMLVEDDDAVRDSLRDLLEDEGFTVLPAANGQEALEKLQEELLPPCVILLDLMMPVMNGWELRQRLLQNETLAEIPVIVISAMQEAKRVALQRLSVAAFIGKPIDVDKLMSQIEAHSIMM